MRRRPKRARGRVARRVAAHLAPTINRGGGDDSFDHSQALLMEDGTELLLETGDQLLTG